MKSRNLAVILVVSCIMLMIGSYATAQEATPSVPSIECPKGGATGDEKHMGGAGGRLKKELGLTDIQMEQLKIMRQKHMTERKTRMNDVNLKVHAILTPDQQAQFDLNKERMMNSKKSSRGGQGGSGMHNSATPGQGADDTSTGPGPKGTPTNLTPGQGEHGAGAPGSGGPGGGNGRGKGMLKALFTGITLTETQKGKLRTIMEEEKTRMKSLKSQRESEIKSILTPPQYKKFEELKKNMKMHGGQQGSEKANRSGGKKHHQGGESQDNGI